MSIPRHPDSHPKGGFHMDKVKNVPNVIPDIIKTLSKKIASGSISNLLNISKPIEMLSHITFLECVANEHKNVDRFLTQAAKATSVKDQLKFIASYLVSGLHSNAPLLYMKVPSDAYLGQTAHFEQEKCDFYSEQISSFPPITLYSIYSKKNEYQVHGYNKIEPKLSGTFNTLRNQNFGNIKIIIKDRIFNVKFPILKVEGIVLGDRIMNCEGEYTISTQEYRCQVKFGKDSAVFSWGKPKELEDQVKIFIYEINEKSEKLIEQGYGSWLSHLRFSEEYTWKIFDNYSKWELINDSPSSIGEREDLQLIKLSKLKKANEIKEYQEQNEEKDRKLRQKRGRQM